MEERKLFVSNKLAKLAKEKGFYKPCMKGIKDGEVLTGCGFSFTNHENTHEYTLPLYQQLVDWLREEHLIFIKVDCKKWMYIFRSVIQHADGEWDSELYNDYYEALNEAIEKAFTLIK